MKLKKPPYAIMGVCFFFLCNVTTMNVKVGKQRVSKVDVFDIRYQTPPSSQKTRVKHE